MPYLNETQTLAEIAISLAGFSGIVIAIRARRSLARDAEFARLRELMLTSFGVVFFAFMPALINGAIGESQWTWQGPQLAFAIYHVYLMYLFFSTAGLDAGHKIEKLFLPPAVAVLVLQFVTGLGFLTEYVEEAYFLALLWFLVIAALNFSLLLLAGEAGPE